MDTEHDWLKVAEVARVLRIARSRAYELVGSGEIPSVRIGRSVRVSREELDRSARRAAPAEREVEMLEKINGCFMVSVMVREWGRTTRVAYDFRMGAGYEPTQHSVDRRRPRGGAKHQADLHAT